MQTLELSNQYSNKNGEVGAGAAKIDYYELIKFRITQEIYAHLKSVKRVLNMSK